MSNQKIIASLCIIIAILIVCVAMLSISMLKKESRLLMHDDAINPNMGYCYAWSDIIQNLSYVCI